MTESAEKRISEKTYLEMAVHILDLEYFNPLVFSHDGYWFEIKKYAQISIAFLNLLVYFDSIGIRVETEQAALTEDEETLYSCIIHERGYEKNIVSYELRAIDFSEMNIATAIIPDGCSETDFSWVKIYLILKTGAALNKKAIENILGRNLTDSEMLTFKKNLEKATGRCIIKREDNSYEQGELYEK